MTTRSKAHERGPRGDQPRPPRRSDGRGITRKSSARDIAVTVIEDVTVRRRPLEESFERAMALSGGHLAARDRAFARLISATVLRRHGELGAVIASFLSKPLPDRTGLLHPILLSAAAQLLCLDTPPHAAISTAVDQCRADKHARHFAGLANAILRRTDREGRAVLAAQDPAQRNFPSWMLERWRKFYGTDTAHAIARASLSEPALDLTVKSDPEAWAARLSGLLLPTGSIRLLDAGRIDELDGYADGAWWVQDAAAALPARLLGDVNDKRIADLCAAPGGKTAELAAAGAHVTAVESSPERTQRITENLARLGLRADVVSADATTWTSPDLFDGVLLDAPCSATGTIRRHPDILHTKRASDIAQLAELQKRLLDNAARLVKEGGLLVYCTCSLEPEEGDEQIRSFLARSQGFARVPVTAGECGIDAVWITRDGDLRTLPAFLPSPDARMSGMDGFYAARLKRIT